LSLIYINLFPKLYSRSIAKSEALSIGPTQKIIAKKGVFGLGVYSFFKLLCAKTNNKIKTTKAIYLLHNLDIKKNGTSFDYQINDIFNQLDKETDNVITQNEFVEGCMKDDFLLYFLNPTI